MTSLHEFRRVLEAPDENLDLARAALVMGIFAYPDLDVEAYMRQTDRLAEDAARAVGRSPGPGELARQLFDVAGFTGNHADYHDPRNSFLNEVLDRRLGIPISLSLLYLEVARRIGLDAQGVGLPGHFIVRARDADGNVVFLDPFHRGVEMDEAACRQRVESLAGNRLAFQRSFLDPVGPRYILSRMLNNLRQIYARNHDYARVVATIERILVLHPDDPAELRNLAAAAVGMGERRRAIEICEQYLTTFPDAGDADAMRRFARQVGDEIGRRN